MRKNKVEYAVVCSTGKIRRNNEDNFYCGGHFREDVSAVCDVAYSGRVDADANELFAVFDGMGGEACGEVASYTAAAQSALFVCGTDKAIDLWRRQQDFDLILVTEDRRLLITEGIEDSFKNIGTMETEVVRLD